MRFSQNWLLFDTPSSIWRFGECKPSIHHLRSECESKFGICGFSEFGCVAKHSNFIVWDQATTLCIYYIWAFVTHDHNIGLGSLGTFDNVNVG
jgi:hypothetical protein